MHFDFDTVIHRYGTDSVKFDFAAEHGYDPDILPLWVADMDFQAPPCVLDALKARVEHGIFGYSDTKADYFEAVRDWFAARFALQLQPQLQAIWADCEHFLTEGMTEEEVATLESLLGRLRVQAAKWMEAE